MSFRELFAWKDLAETNLARVTARIMQTNFISAQGNKQTVEQAVKQLLNGGL